MYRIFNIISYINHFISYLLNLNLQVSNKNFSEKSAFETGLLFFKKLFFDIWPTNDLLSFAWLFSVVPFFSSVSVCSFHVPSNLCKHNGRLVNTNGNQWKWRPGHPGSWSGSFWIGFEWEFEENGGLAAQGLDIEVV